MNPGPVAPRGADVVEFHTAGFIRDGRDRWMMNVPWVSAAILPARNLPGKGLGCDGRIFHEAGERGGK